MEMDFLCVIYFSATVLHYSCSYQKETGKVFLYFKVCKSSVGFYCTSNMCSNNTFVINMCMCISIHNFFHILEKFKKIKSERFARRMWIYEHTLQIP